MNYTEEQVKAALKWDDSQTENSISSSGNYPNAQILAAALRDVAPEQGEARPMKEGEVCLNTKCHYYDTRYEQYCAGANDIESPAAEFCTGWREPAEDVDVEDVSGTHHVVKKSDRILAMKLHEMWEDYADDIEENSLRIAIYRENQGKALRTQLAERDAEIARLREALSTREVKEAIGRFRGVWEFFDIGDCSAECDGNTLADAISAALAMREGKA